MMEFSSFLRFFDGFLRDFSEYIFFQISPRQKDGAHKRNSRKKRDFDSLPQAFVWFFKFVSNYRPFKKKLVKF